MSTSLATPLAPGLLAALRDLLATFCGVYLDDTRLGALETAICHRLRATDQSAAAYAALLRSGAAPDELQRLAELLLNHETQFFRNRAHLAVLREHVLPELHRRLAPGAPLRLWSAGCATGEEPYSLAIAAYEALGDPLPRPVEIWATDLSGPALDHGRAGIYHGRSLANLSGSQRARFFTAHGDGLTVHERLRRLVRFERLNLLEPFPPTARGVQVVFCQNVTIYFQVSACRALMERFYLHMAEGGYLFLGFSETLWNIFDRFRWCELDGAYLYRKEQQPPTAPAPGQPRRLRHRRGLPVGPLSGAEILEQGRALLDEGRAEAALELFAQAPLAGATGPQILALAARAHADRGDLDLAAAEARRALELSPLTTEAHLLIGLIHARQGRPLAAIAQLERARYLDRDSPVVAFHLAECYRQAGRAESALREYRNARSRLDGHPPDKLFDGVAAEWLSQTCRYYEAALSGIGHREGA